MSEEVKSDVESRITQYLSLGGLFNPELMEHDKVRDLIIDCRAQLAQQKAMLDEAVSVIEFAFRFGSECFEEHRDTSARKLSENAKAFLAKTKEKENEL